MKRAALVFAVILTLSACAAPSARRTSAPKISGRPVAGETQCVKFLKKHNSDLQLKTTHAKLVKLYYEEAGREGIRPDIAFAQAIVETGYFKSARAVGQNNFCGLGATGGSVRGAEFDDVKTGVRACVQHLKAYASKEPPKTKIVDPRYHYVTPGRATTWADLSGAWAADRKYHTKILAVYERILSE